MRVRIWALCVIAALCTGTQALAAEGARVQVHLVPDPSGRIEVTMHKLYGPGQTADAIPLPSDSAAGYPQVRVVTSEGVTAEQSAGLVTVRSQAPGRVSLYVVDMGRRSVTGLDSFSYLWVLQDRGAEGMGAVSAQVHVTLPPGAILRPGENGIRIVGTAERLIQPRVDGESWQAEATIQPGETALVSLQYTMRPTLVPEWAIPVIAGLLIAGYYAFRRYRATAGMRA